MNQFPYTFPARLSEPLAITHVTVVPLDEERLLADHTVIIKNGVIRALGPSNVIETTGTCVIDGTGKYLLPGLADMHVHYWDVGEFTMFLASGVTLVRNMWGGPLHLALEQQVRQGALPGPHIITTSPIIDGLGHRGKTVHQGSILLTEPQAAAALVKRYAARGYQQIKAYSQLTPATLQALGEAAKAVGLRMVGHCPQSMTFEEAIAAGMSCFEHLTAITNGHMLEGFNLNNFKLSRMEYLSLQAQYIDYEAIRRLAQYMAVEHIWNCPTLVVWQSLAVEQAVLMQNPLLRYQLPTRVGLFSEVRLPDSEFTERERLEIGKAWEEMRLRIVAILHEEGVPLLLGTDTPNPHVYQGFAIHEELALFVRAGLRPYEALLTGTREAARFLGESELWGTVSVGKRADLLLVETNPLAEVAAVQRPEAVFVNEFYLTREVLDALLAQKVAFVSDVYRYLPIELEAVASEERIVVAGMWQETIADTEVDRVAYRHTRLEDETWLIEQCYIATRGNSGGLHRHKTRLWMRPDGVVLRAEERRELLLGEETCIVERTGQGGYRAERREVDGCETVTMLAADVLVPGERLAITALPLLLKAQGQLENEVSLSALNVDANCVSIVPMKLVPLLEDENTSKELGVHWEVIIERPGWSTSMVFCLALDGTFLGMKTQSCVWKPVKE